MVLVLLVLSVVMQSGCASWESNESSSLRPRPLAPAPVCADDYYRTLASQGVPKRWYKYFHEALDTTYSDIQWRIIGGKALDIVNAPYTILYGPYCGGSLISPVWVLTAAHCRTKDQYIVAGSTKISEGVRYEVCAHFVHPLWNAPNKTHFHDFDYMLLLLKRPVPVTSQSRPIAIARPGDLQPGTMVTVTGWGHTKVKQHAMEDILRQVSVPIMTHELCRTMDHKYYKNVTPHMFCAGYVNGTKDSCQGDSGGPAVANNRLLGLVSFGVGCAQQQKPGVYANIPAARLWIREVTGLPL